MSSSTEGGEGGPIRLIQPDFQVEGKAIFLLQ